MDYTLCSSRRAFVVYAIRVTQYALPSARADLFAEQIGGGGKRFVELGRTAAGLRESRLTAAAPIGSACDLTHQAAGVDPPFDPIGRDLGHEQRAAVGRPGQHH